MMSRQCMLARSDSVGSMGKGNKIKGFEAHNVMLMCARWE
jgi:hypothetical protein